MTNLVLWFAREKLINPTTDQWNQNDRKKNTINYTKYIHISPKLHILSPLPQSWFAVYFCCWNVGTASHISSWYKISETEQQSSFDTTFCVLKGIRVPGIKQVRMARVGAFYCTFPLSMKLGVLLSCGSELYWLCRRDTSKNN